MMNKQSDRNEYTENWHDIALEQNLDPKLLNTLAVNFRTMKKADEDLTSVAYCENLKKNLLGALGQGITQPE